MQMLNTEAEIDDIQYVYIVCSVVVVAVRDGRWQDSFLTLETAVWQGKISIFPELVSEVFNYISCLPHWTELLGN